MDSNLEALARLNDLYIQSIVKSDAAQFEQILAGDFLCSNPDGSLVDKSEFLRRIRGTKPLQYMHTEDVRIRVIGDTGIVHARTVFASADGTTGVGRYTDVWAKRNGEWLAVSAHVTRIAK